MINLVREMGPYYEACTTDLVPYFCKPGTSEIIATLYEGCVSFYGWPIEVGFANRKQMNELIDGLVTFMRLHDAKKIILRDPTIDTYTTTLGLACLAHKGTPELRVRAVANLWMSEDELWADVRKSYHSLINWGKREMMTMHAQAGHVDVLRALHRKAASRDTRPQASWVEMAGAVIEGRALLYVSWLDDKPISGTFIWHNKTHALYGTGAYDREQFDKPLAHWPLWAAMLECKRKGIRWFDLGQIEYGKDQKLDGISLFKKGFTSRMEQSVVWTIRNDELAKAGDYETCGGFTGDEMREQQAHLEHIRRRDSVQA